MKRVHVLEKDEEDANIYKDLEWIKGFVYDADVKENAIDRENRPPRKVPYAIMDDVKKELDSIKNGGIIKKINVSTPFCGQMVIVKQRGKLGIRLGPTDFNKILLRRHLLLMTLEEIAAQVSGSEVFTVLDSNKKFW